MTRTLLIRAALLAFAAGAAEAQAPHAVEPLEQSYELGFGDVVFMTDPAGSVSLRPCSSCARVAHRVTRATVYLVGDEQVPFEGFQKVLAQRRAARRATYVGVHYSIDTRDVTRIRLK